MTWIIEVRIRKTAPWIKFHVPLIDEWIPDDEKSLSILELEWPDNKLQKRTPDDVQ